jgi:hypothetical protein
MSKKKYTKLSLKKRKSIYKLRKNTYKVSKKKKNVSGGGGIHDVAILIPISPKGYDMLYKLLNKLISNHITIDIFLVFSSQADYDSFGMKNHIKPILIGNDVDMSNKTDATVCFKKLFGLNSLVNSKYEYIICCDDEVDIIPENLTEVNLKDKITQIYNNKKVYAGKITPDSNAVLQSRILPQLDQSYMQMARNSLEASAKLFPNYYERLKSVTENFTLYFWWSDLPVYKRDTIEDFLTTINYKNIDYTAQSNNYDHIIYLFYLITKHNFEIVDTTPVLNLNWSLEYLDTSDTGKLDALSHLKFGFSWVNNITYTTMKHYLLSHKTIFIFSTDRKFVL